jgi:hypothetical protein
MKVFFSAMSLLMCLLWSDGITHPATAQENGHVLIQQSVIGGNSWNSGLRVAAETADGKSIAKLFGKPAKAPAGRRTIGLRIEFQIKAPFWDRQEKYSDVINFSAQLEAGRTYKANGRQKGRLVEVWIEDAKSGEFASKVLSILTKECKLSQRLNCPSPELKVRAKL